MLAPVLFAFVPPPPPHPLAINIAATITSIHASGPTWRHARCREFRAFHVKTSVGNSNANAVFSMPRVRSGTRSFAATAVTVLMVAVELCAVPESVTLEGRIEQVAYGADTTGEQFNTTVPLKPLDGVMVRP